MNKYSILHILLLVIASSLTLVAQPQVIDRVVALVGKECLLLSDLNLQLELYAGNNQLDANTPGMREKMLDVMINDKLILARALEDTTISVSDEEVNGQLETKIAERVQQFGSEKKLEEYYGGPISKMKREFREEMRNQLYTGKLQQGHFADVRATHREVNEFFEQYKDSLPRVPEELELYHIFKTPTLSDDAKNQVKAQAKKILDSINTGGDFSDYAKRYSSDLGSAAHGGDLGSIRRGQFVKDFEEVVFGMKDNEFAGPVETQFGIHIIQLLERRGDVVHARHILLKVERDSTSDATTISFLQSLKDSVAQGAQFTALAKKYSDDKESAPMGGLLGNYPVEQFDESVQHVVKDVPAGSITEPLAIEKGAAKGYQIIYVKKRTPAHAMNLTDDWTRLEQLAGNFKRNREYQKWIEQLRTEIYWEKRL